MRSSLLALLVACSSPVLEDDVLDAQTEPDAYVPSLVGIAFDAQFTHEYEYGVNCIGPDKFVSSVTGLNEVHPVLHLTWPDVPCSPLQRNANELSLACGVHIVGGLPPWYFLYAYIDLFRNGFDGSLSGFLNFVVDGEQYFFCQLTYQISVTEETHE